MTPNIDSGRLLARIILERRDAPGDGEAYASRQVFGGELPGAPLSFDTALFLYVRTRGEEQELRLSAECASGPGPGGLAVGASAAAALASFRGDWDGSRAAVPAPPPPAFAAATPRTAVESVLAWVSGFPGRPLLAHVEYLGEAGARYHFERHIPPPARGG